MPLTAEQRRALPESDFAVPSKRALPINDARHVRMAWSQVDHTSGLSDAEKAAARARIRAKAKALGVDTSGWDMKAASDAGLFVSRPLSPASAAAVRTWARTQGFTHPMQADDLHVTIVQSAVTPDLDPHTHEVRIEGGDRSLVRLGDQGAIVLRFDSDELRARWQEARDAGAVWDYDDYLPHVTISYGPEPTDIDDATPFTGDLVFGPERHVPRDAEAAAAAADRARPQEHPAMMQAEGIRLEGEGLEAMALQMPDVKGHPNRMPFSGVLTRLDRPSDRPPGGSKGKRVVMTTKAAQRALPSLLGMAVNYVDTQDGHAVTRKVGVITAAAIEVDAIKGDAVKIDGILYARDFPAETARIQTDKKDLGFSWELAEIYVERLDADPLVITDAYFTGAAILRKDKAAYSSTSLAASAGDHDMTKEEIAAAVGESVSAAMGAALKPISDTVAALQAAHDAQAKQLAEMQAAAEKTKTDEAAAAQVAKDKELEELKTKVADLTAAADKAKTAPERKTLAPAITALLARADLSIPTDGAKLSIGAIDAALAKSNLDPVKRMEIKGALKRADLVAG